MLKIITFIFLSFVCLFGCSEQHHDSLEHDFIEKLQITPALPSIAAGLSQQMKAIAILSDGYTRDVTSQVSWTSSDTRVATVTPEGKIQTLVPGQATITASISNPDLSIVSLDVPVTIRNAVVTSLQITPALPSIAAGLSQQMKAIAILSDGYTRDVTSQVSWTSSDTRVATVTPEGTIQTLVPGQATITASISNLDLSIVSLDVPVTIRNAVVTSLQITPALPSIAAGLSQQMKAIAILSDGYTRDVTSQVSWTSSDTRVATVT
ncbi:Ig-like domain-containing protein, partial [Aeromonas veronii]|uniref:Ig-like domain-containing protein n=1 Tax=Aeromonas veronii TaxID=654 RepID=UPI0018759203